MKVFFKVLVISFCFIYSCKKNENNLTKLNGRVFGTTYSIIYNGDTSHNLSIDSIFNTVNHSLSTYTPTSDISRINNNDTLVLVDDLFVEVFQKAKRIHKETDGYFDPTVGPLVNLYGFGSESETSKYTEEKFNHLKSLVGFEKVSLKGRKIIKENPEIKFDVNAFAKGYALDLVGRFFENKNIKNYLIEIGGEIRVRGKKNGKKWKLGIDEPNTDGTQSIKKIIELTDKSMATSGNYRKFRVNNDGKKFVHILNPKTGLAEESNLLSASVISNLDCADVDAYATAFMVMGLEKTQKFIKTHKNLKVILMYLDSNNKLCIYEN